MDQAKEARCRDGPIKDMDGLKAAMDDSRCHRDDFQIHTAVTKLRR